MPGRLREFFQAVRGEEELPRNTLSLCPVCDQVCAAEIYDRAGDVYMRKTCPVHGNFDELFYRDTSLYRSVSRLIARNGLCPNQVKCASFQPCHDHLSHTYNIMINVTQRCNLSCPVCFATVAAGNQWPEPTAEEIFARLPTPRSKNNPHVVFIGGEPTLRDDLPHLIRGVTQRGFITRLSTNGLKMQDRDYAKTLFDAGLRWIVLQFDGLNDKTYTALRRRPLLKEKKRVIEVCEDLGITVQFAVMVDRQRNANEVGAIIDYAFSQPIVKWVNFYPRSSINRNEFGDDEKSLHVAEMLDIFEEQTNGRLTREDFLAMMRIMSHLHKLTGKVVFQQKLSTYPMILIRTGDGLVPLPRLRTPWGLLKHHQAAGVILRSIPDIIDYEKLRMPQEVLFITMEKFHDHNTIDLLEASCCHMAFVLKDGFTPFDIFNRLYRSRPNWGTSRQQST